MFKKIRSYFRDLRVMVYRSAEFSGFARKDIAIISESVQELCQRQYEGFMQITKSQSEIMKRISSIEIELLMKRGACTDNNFEGKVNL